MKASRNDGDVVDAVCSISDALRSGSSLRRAIVDCAGERGSPLAAVASSLQSGQPLAFALRDAAHEALRSGASGNGADTSSVLCILALHAEAGGDPLPACGALASRLQRRVAAREEARALTTQARLGSRVLLALTPGFLALVAISDPHGALRWLTDPRSRSAIVAGIALQIGGGVWIRAIVRNASDRLRASRLPFLRVLRALLVGKPRSSLEDEIADACELVAFALDSGVSPSSALSSVAPFVRGRFGELIRDAACDAFVPVHGALRERCEPMGESAIRFSRAFERSATLGVPLAPVLRSLSDEIHERSAVRLQEDVRRAGVRVLLPLSVLVLPAFVLACLVPLFVGGLQGIAG